MRKLTIGLIVLITAVVLTAGAAAAHGMASAATDDSDATDETPMDNQQEEGEAMMGEMDDCPMVDGGMMGMMHDDRMECQEMMGEEMMNEMNDEMREECQEMMDEEMMGEMDGTCPMMDNDNMMDGMTDGGMGNMMNEDGSGMGCH